MSTLRIPAERAEIHATMRMQRGIHPPLRLVRPIAGSAPACLNCDEPLDANFCRYCGQAAKVKRFTFGAFLHELPHEILHLDHALTHTLRALLTKPGPTIRDYLAGRRAKIYSPIALLFTVAGLLAVLSVWLHVDITQTKVTGNGELNGITQRVTQSFAQYHAWVTLLLIPLDAVAPYVVLRRRTGLGYAEQMMASTMIAIGYTIVGLVFVPVLWLANHFHHGYDAVSGIRDAISFAYTIWALTSMQNDGRSDDTVARRIGRSVGTLAGMGIVYFSVMTVLIIGFFLSYVITSVGLRHFGHHFTKQLGF